MRSTILAAVAVLVVQVHGFAAEDVTDVVKGDKVLPKLNVIVKDGKETINGRDFNVPWVVQDVKGEMLLVGDQRKGWAKRSDVLTADEATPYYTQFIQFNSRFVKDKNNRLKLWAYRLRGYARALNGEWDQAVADFGECIRLDPNGFTYADRALAWNGKNEFEHAIADADEAIRLDPSYKYAYYNRGFARNARQEFDKAIGDFDEAVRLDPNYADAYLCRGTIWNRKKDYNKALVDLNEAIRLEPNNATAYTLRGFVWSAKKDFEKSLADYDEALRQDPTKADTHYNRGGVRYASGDFDKAIADYSRAIQIGPEAFIGLRRPRICLERKEEL